MSGVDCDNALLVQRGRNQSLFTTDETRDFTRARYIFGFCLNLFCLLVWVVEKPKFERTRVRPTIFLVLAIFCSLAEMSCGPLASFARDSYPCWLGVILLVMTIPFAAGSVTGKYMLYSFLSRFAQSASAVSKQKTDVDDSQSVVSGRHHGARSFLHRARLVAEKVMYPNQQATSEAELYDLKLLSSPLGTFTLTLILTLPFLVLSFILLATDPVVVGCFHCAYDRTTINAIIGVAVVELAVGLGFWYAASKNKSEDQWGIKAECFRSLFWLVIGVIGFLLSVFDTGQNQINLQPYTHSFMMTFGLWMVVVEQSIVQIFFARYNDWKMKREQVAPLSPRTKSSAVITATSQVAPQDELEHILANKSLCELFERHLVGEFGVESLFFLQQAEEWKRTHVDISPTARTARARRIYKSYVMTSGLYSINLPSAIYERIKRNLEAGAQSGGNDVDREIFDEAIKEIRNLLSIGAVLRFQSSTDYKSAMQNGDGIMVAGNEGIGREGHSTASTRSPSRQVSKKKVPATSSTTSS